jgi:hypothetical protein
MAGPNDAWHETLTDDGPAPGSSDRFFGYIFAGLFAFLGITRLWHNQPSAYWWLLAALAVFLLARFMAPLLSPFNRVCDGSGWRCRA